MVVNIFHKKTKTIVKYLYNVIEAVYPVSSQAVRYPFCLLLFCFFGRKTKPSLLRLHIFDWAAFPCEAIAA